MGLRDRRAKVAASCVVLIGTLSLATAAPGSPGSGAEAPVASPLAKKKKPKCGPKKPKGKKKRRKQCGVPPPTPAPAPGTPTPKHVLTVTVAGPPGTVTSNPVGIVCPGDCAEAYDAGTIVALSQSPPINSAFSGWSGACTGTGACTVTMDAAKSVTAAYVALRHLTLSVSGNGTASANPSGSDCGTGCYLDGTPVTLTANYNPSTTEFLGWTDGVTFIGFSNPIVITMSQDHSVEAKFVPKPDFGG
jgi:hypothetical protein